MNSKQNSLSNSIKFYFLLCGIIPLLSIYDLRIFNASLSTYVLLIILIINIKCYNYNLINNYIKNKYFYPIHLLLLLITINLLINEYNIRQLLPFILIYLSFLVGVNLVYKPDENSISRLLFWIEIGGILACTLGVMQFLFELNLYPSDVVPSTNIYDKVRITGGLLSPNGYGYFCTLIAAIQIAKIFDVNSSKNKIIYLLRFLYLILLLSQILLSGSRSALLGFCIAILYFIFTKGNKNLSFYLSSIFICVLSITIIVLLSEPLEIFISRSFDDPRFDLWKNALDFFINNPLILLIGLGIGDDNRFEVNFSDNLFIEIVFFGGLPLLFSFLWLLVKKNPKITSIQTINKNNLSLISIIQMWKIIFFISCLFSSAIAFIPYAQIYFIVTFFASRLENN